MSVWDSLNQTTRKEPMSYEIIIKERREVKKLAGGEWTQVGDEEVMREVGMFTAANPDEPKTRIKSVYGYTPEVERFVTEDREVLKQTVDSLDLCAVIKAINGL